MTGFDNNKQNQTANDQLDHFAPTEEVTVLYVIIYTIAQCVHIRNFISSRIKRRKFWTKLFHKSDYEDKYEFFEFFENNINKLERKVSCFHKK